jgi:non-ribosomal peptide synthetase component F
VQAAALAAGLVPGWLDAEVPEPAAVALCELGTTAMDVTYASLAAWSRAATVQLRAGGVSPGDFVGLAVAEGATLLVQQLACWRCGAAFVPLDTAALPATRLQYLVRDAGLRAVLAAASEAPRLRTLLDDSGAEVIVAGPAVAEDTTCGLEPLSPPPNADGGAMVSHMAYTSGSSGRPKGVVCEHRQLVAYCVANAAQHAVAATARVLLAAAPSFDPSIGEAYT